MRELINKLKSLDTDHDGFIPLSFAIRSVEDFFRDHYSDKCYDNHKGWKVSYEIISDKDNFTAN